MRNTSGHRQLHTPTSQDVSMQGAERIKVNSVPPVVVNIRPVIESSSFTEHTYGVIADLAPTMSAAVMELLERLGSFGRFATLSKSGAHPCAERHLATRETYWTLENPGHYACKTCFNRKQPCIRSTGNHQWIILPLPPNVRGPGLSWQDKAYYINPYEGSSIRYSGTWRVQPHKGTSVKREQESAVE